MRGSRPNANLNSTQCVCVCVYPVQAMRSLTSFSCSWSPCSLPDNPTSKLFRCTATSRCARHLLCSVPSGCGLIATSASFFPCLRLPASESAFVHQQPLPSPVYVEGVSVVPAALQESCPPISDLVAVVIPHSFGASVGVVAKS